jgi:Spy/CpxP family protein refolding chaperone
MKRLSLRGWLPVGVGISVAIGLAAVVSAQQQQQQRGAGPGPAAIVEHLRQIVEELNLTPDQRSKTDAILDKAQEQMTGLRGQLRDMDPQARADKLREVIGGATQQIAAELTPEQKAQFQSRVDEARSAVAGGARGQLLDRVRSAIGSVNLTDDQKTKITSLLDDTSKKLGEAAAQGQPPREAMQALREQLSQILTPEQLQTLRDKMQQDGGGARRLGLNNRGKAADSSPAVAQPATKPAAAAGGDAHPMTEQTMTGGMAAGGAPAKVTTPAAESASEPGTPLDPGAVAPEFKLRTLDGTTEQLSSLKGRVIVLFFGSYTCPTFRDRAQAIDRIARQLSTAASVYVIYTREAHPTGGWEVQRNKDEHIALAQPASYTARQSAARECRSTLHLSVPLLVDEMDDATAAAYGGFPNGAVVINRDGTIAASQQWADPPALQRYVDDAVAKKYHPAAEK